MNKDLITIGCLGYSLEADWYADNPDSVIIFFTGYASARQRSAAFFAAVTAKTNASALTVDLSGHGASPLALDETRPAQHVLEGMAVFDWVKQHYQTAKITVFGTSYGAFIAAYIAKYRAFDKLVLRTPAIYQPEVFYTQQKDIDRSYTSNIYRKDAKAVAVHPLFALPHTFNGPTLVVVHGDDENVPLQTSDAYIRAFSAEQWTATGFKHSMRDPHNDRSLFAAYEDTVAGWINKPSHSP